MALKLFIIAIISLLLAGCANTAYVNSNLATTTAKTNFKHMIKISSPAFVNATALPVDYTCDGEGVNPPLTIGEIPYTAKSLVLIADDPDAPKGVFTHWLVFDFDPKTREIPAGETPRGAVLGKNDFGKNEYGAPCPPSGTHRYFFHLYALDAELNLPAGASRAKVEAAMKGHIIDSAEIFATYKR